MNKIRLAGAAIILLLIFWGCGPHRKNYYNSVAPVSTYSVTFVDNFSQSDRDELISSVASIFSNVLGQVRPTNNYYVVINITNEKVGPSNHNNSVLVYCGDQNECPDLNEVLCNILENDGQP